MIAGDEVLTYDDLADHVARAQAGLGPAPQLVGLVPAPTIEFVVAYLAALAGGHAVLLSRDQVLPRAYGASATWADGGFAPTGRPAPALHPELRLLLSTSGSTGSPKLVRLSRTNLESNAEAIASYLGLTADDRAITTLPLRLLLRPVGAAQPPGRRRLGVVLRTVGRRAGALGRCPRRQG